MPTENDYRAEWAALPDPRLIETARKELARVIMRRVLADLRRQAASAATKPDEEQER